MKSINLSTYGKVAGIVDRLQAEGYVSELMLYEHDSGYRTTLQWTRYVSVEGNRVARKIWLTDDGYLGTEVLAYGKGRDAYPSEGTPTRDIDIALAEIERLASDVAAEIAKAAA